MFSWCTVFCLWLCNESTLIIMIMGIIMIVHTYLLLDGSSKTIRQPVRQTDIQLHWLEASLQDSAYCPCRLSPLPCSIFSVWYTLYRFYFISFGEKHEPLLILTAKNLDYWMTLWGAALSWSRDHLVSCRPRQLTSMSFVVSCSV